MKHSTHRRAVTWMSVTAALALLLTTHRGRAQADDWLVVPVTAGEDVARAHAIAKDVEQDLAQRGFQVQASEVAAERFEQRVSVSASALSVDQIDAWKQRSRAALGSLARNDYEGALRELEAAQATSRAAVAALNRNDETSAILLDTCLYTVRALLGVGKQATAQVQAAECAQLSPGIAPNTKMHPPAIRTFYADVVDAGRARTGTLSVDSKPSGCEARVNGIRVGPTPARVEQRPEGAYAVQVECGTTPGRIHRVQVEKGQNSVSVDADLDAVVRTRGGLRLEYTAQPDVSILETHALALSEVLDASRVILVAEHEGGATELILFDAVAEKRKSAIVAGSSTAAVDALLHDPPPVAPPTRPPRGQFIAGVSLAAIGTASLLSAYALYGVSATKVADEMIAAPTNDNQAHWLNLRFGTFYAGSAGAAALVTAMPLALPYRPKTPWWAWLSGSAGLGLAVTSIALAVTAPSTPDVSRVADPQGYVDRAKRTDGAFLAGVSAAPLLTMPLVYLLRRDDKRVRAELAPQLIVSREGGFLGISGNY